MSKKLIVEINKTIEIELKDYEIKDIIQQYGKFDEDKSFEYFKDDIEDELLLNLELCSDIIIEDDEEE